MSSSIWNKDTLLDISVNIIPLAILAIFIVLFLLSNPFGGPALGLYLQMAIILSVFVGLAVLTYMAAVRIEGEDGESEASESAH